MLKQLLCSIGLIGLALILLATRSSPWFDLGIGLLLLGGLLALFTVQDAIVLALQRSGRPADSYRVLVHLGSAIMAMIAATAFADDDPRVHDIRWFLLIGLPLLPYLHALLWKAITRYLFGCGKSL
jgi:hypothetical protein